VKHQDLIGRLERAWAALLESYHGLSDAELLEAGVTGDWSVRDLVAHITWWEEEALRHLPIVLAGGTPPRYATAHGGIDAFNAKMTAQVRDRSLAEVLRHRDEVHRRLLAFIETVPEDRLSGKTRARRRLRLDTYAHYPKHAQAIRRWRDRRAHRPSC
jgi:DinB superfamily